MLKDPQFESVYTFRGSLRSLSGAFYSNGIYPLLWMWISDLNKQVNECCSFQMQKNFKSPFQGLTSGEHTAVCPFPEMECFFYKSPGRHKFDFKILSKKKPTFITCTNCNHFRLCEVVRKHVHLSTVQSTKISFGKHPVEVVVFSFLNSCRKQRQAMSVQHWPIRKR